MGAVGSVASDSGMDARQLEYVVAIADEESFTRAAARCHVAQSALSHQVARLETEFGVRIFDRTSRSVRLSEAGRVFLPHARQILEEFANARATLDALAGVTRGRLRIGMTQDATRALDLIALVGRFHRRYPEVNLSTMTGPGQELNDAILDNRLDLAFAAVLCEGASSGLTFLSLVEDPLVVIVPSDHQLARRKQVRLAELADEEFVEFRSGMTLRKRIDVAFAAADIRRTSGFEVGQIAEMVQYVAHGLGMAIVPQSFVSQVPVGDAGQGDIEVLRLVEPRLHLQIGVHIRSDQQSAPSQKLLAILAKDSVAVESFLHGMRTGSIGAAGSDADA